MPINRLQADGVNPSPDRQDTNLVSGSVTVTPADDAGNNASKLTLNTRGPMVWTINIPALSALANAQSYKFTPGVAGRILSVQFMVTTAVTTGSKAATLQTKIATVATTGGAVSLTSANCTPIGAEVDGSAITGANTFTAAQQISVDVSAVTAFVEGAGQIVVVFG